MKWWESSSKDTGAKLCAGHGHAAAPKSLPGLPFQPPLAQQQWCELFHYQILTQYPVWVSTLPRKHINLSPVHAELRLSALNAGRERCPRVTTIAQGRIDRSSHHKLKNVYLCESLIRLHDYLKTMLQEFQCSLVNP